MRAAHEATLALTFECSEEVIAAPAMPAKAKHTLESALRFWEEQKMCDDEDVWHEFFSANGEILALSLPGSALQIGSKCFVGGKDYLNQGGGITDFIYTPHDYEGVTLVEIKTPETRLIGSQYRNRCFAPSADLSGSVVQALHYKRLAQSDLQKLFERAARKPSFDDIQVAVLVGKSESLDTESEKRRSFQLFKSAVREVQIITYDELFGKVKMILEIPR
ncbi:Shedu immune nuclease family protein [Rhizobium sp.]|uniref:Shedu immune nuclease family protein n=1 Tax=Rhizobium sp. TaxID=391 RepID=UPI002899BFD0